MFATNIPPERLAWMEKMCRLVANNIVGGGGGCLVTLGDLLDVTGSFTYADGKVLRANGTSYVEDNLDYSDLSGTPSIPVNFTDLSDTPSSYVDQGGKGVFVKADATGLEFVSDTKMVLVPTATENHIATFDDAGQVKDSGAVVGDFEVAGAVSGHESTYNHSNYNTAYGWGDHASAGYYIIASNTLDDIADGTTYKLVTAAEKSALHAAGSDDTITVAEETTDTTCYINFTTAKSGDLQPKTNDALQFNSNTGVLTFSELPILPSEDPTTDYQAASKKYVDDNAGGTNTVTFNIEGASDLYPEWAYFDTFLVEHDGDTIADYVDYITVDTATLISDEKMQSNGADIRIYNVTDDEELKHTVKSGINTSSTIIRFKISNFNENKTLKIFYGNPDATTVDSPSDVYQFYEPFTNLDNWTAIYGTKSNFEISGGKCNKSSDGVDILCSNTTLTTKSSGYVFEWKQQYPALGSTYQNWIGLTPHNAWEAGFQSNIVFTQYYGSIAVYNNITVVSISGSSYVLDWGSLTDTDEHEYRLIRNSSNDLKLLEDGSEVASGNDSYIDDLDETLYVAFYAAKSGITLDSIAVYPYTSSTITVGALQGEQSNSGDTTTMNLEELTIFNY